MITIADLDRILELMQGYGLQSLRAKVGGTLLMVRLSTAGAAPATERQEVAIHTEAVGRFRRSHPGQDAPLVSVGDQVLARTIVGLVENGPVLLPIAAGRAGEIGRIEVEDGSLLGFGARVMTVLAKA